jgi:hypothetical protein
MPREVEHNKLEPAHNTLLEEAYNKQPEERHTPLVGAHTLLLVDTVAAPGNFPGDRQVVEVKYFLAQRLLLHWLKLRWLEAILSFSWFTSLLKIGLLLWATICAAL